MWKIKNGKFLENYYIFECFEALNKEYNINQSSKYVKFICCPTLSSILIIC